MNSRHALFCTLLPALFALLSGFGCLHSSGPPGPAAESYKGTRVEYEGLLYWILDGDLYVQESDGSFRYLAHLYDPDFYERNYAEIDGNVYRVDPETHELVPTVTSFGDGFEGVETPAELISLDRWHSNNADPGGAGGEHNYFHAGSRIDVVHTPVQSGVNSLRCHTEPGSDVAKASLARDLVHYTRGDDVYFRFWLHLDETAGPGPLLALLDLESTWIMENQGLRVVVLDRTLAVELKSFAKRTYRQPEGDEVRLPIGQWVEIRGHIRLSFEDEGVVQLWQDGALVIDARGMTLPVPDAILNSLEVGVTASGPDAETATTLHMDDLAVSDRPID